MQLFDAMGRPIKMEADDVEHHGVLGMKWGRRRYQNPDGSLTALGRRRLERERDRAVKKAEKAEMKQVKKAYQRADKEQKRADEIADKKANLMLKGTRKQVYKNRDLFTKQEMQEYLQRQQQIEAISKGTDTEGLLKAKEFVDKMALGVSIGSTALSTWNTAANIVNSLTGKEKLPEFNIAKKIEKAKKAEEELKKKTEEATKKARQQMINKMTPEQIARNYSNLTSEELKDLANRRTNIGRLDKYLNETYRPQQDALKAARYASGIMSSTDIKNGKKFVANFSSYAPSFSSNLGSGTVVEGKKLVGDLLNMSDGEFWSKWYPAPNATYKVDKNTVLPASSYNTVNSLIDDAYIPKSFTPPSTSDMDDLFASVDDDALRRYILNTGNSERKKKKK